jgi:hypothetical protein
VLLFESLIDAGLFHVLQEDEFNVNCFDLGPLKRIVIGHDCREGSYGWFCDKVYVRNLKTCTEYYFQCGKWMSSTEVDQLTLREFSVASVSQYKGEASSLKNKYSSLLL